MEFSDSYQFAVNYSQSQHLLFRARVHCDWFDANSPLVIGVSSGSLNYVAPEKNNSVFGLSLSVKAEQINGKVKLTSLVWGNELSFADFCLTVNLQDLEVVTQYANFCFAELSVKLMSVAEEHYKQLKMAENARLAQFHRDLF